MAGNRRRSKKPRTRFQAATSASPAAQVPTRWVKFVVGIFLLAPAWVLTQTFFTAFARATVREAFWATEEFWFFSLGAAVWLVIFFGFPRPVFSCPAWMRPQWFYVFGHELTHAIWVWLHGGKVHRFHVSTSGGHIVTDKTNTWIALAPYFFPIYSLVVIAIYGEASLLCDMTPYREWLYAGVGFTWAFHFSFTCWMIPKGQPDLTYGGTFFSLVLIYLLNLVLLAALLIIASPGVSLKGFTLDLLRNGADFSFQLTRLLKTRF